MSSRAIARTVASLALTLPLVSCSDDGGSGNVAYAESAPTENAEVAESLALGPAFDNTRVGTADGPRGPVDRTVPVDFETGELWTLDDPDVPTLFVAMSRDTELQLVAGGPPGSTRCLRIDQQTGSFVEDGVTKFADVTWFNAAGLPVGARANALSMWVRVDEPPSSRPDSLRLGARSYLADDEERADGDRAVSTVFEDRTGFASAEWRQILVRIHGGAADARSRDGGWELELDRAEILPDHDALFWQFVTADRSTGPGAVHLDDIQWFYQNPFVATFPHVSVRRGRPGGTVTHPIIVWNTHPERTRNLHLRGRGWRVALGADWKGAGLRLTDLDGHELTETGPLAPGAGVVVLAELGVPEMSADGVLVREGDEGVFHLDVYETPEDFFQATGDVDLGTVDIQRVDVVLRTVATFGDTFDDRPAPPVNDLAVADRGGSWTRVAWTCPASTASTLAYALRYSTSPIDDEASWSAAVPVEGVPALRGDVARQEHVVRGLRAGTRYWIALRTYSEDGAGSPVAVTTLTTADSDTPVDPAATGTRDLTVSDDDSSAPEEPLADAEGPPASDDETVDPPASDPDEVCAPLDPPGGAVIRVSPTQADSLASTIASAVTGTTILLEDGLYDLSGGDTRHRLVFRTPGLTLRSASGDPTTVVLDGNYGTGEILDIRASHTTIADLTVRRARHHNVHVVGNETSNVDHVRLHNLRLIDAGQQSVKVNPASGHYTDHGVISCSVIELTDEGRPRVSNCYTGGVDVHGSDGWRVVRNTIRGFWCPAGLSEHAIHFWAGSRGTVVESNTIIDCVRGIGFGLTQDRAGRVFPESETCSGAGTTGHYGGVIRNNFIVATDERLFASNAGFDSGISLEQACGVRVAHNTVVSTQAPFASIEFRWERTQAEIVNNLVSHTIRRRDNASGTLSGNITGAALSLFVDVAGGDLHLRPDASAAIGQGFAIADGLADEDIDGDARDRSAPDVGADQVSTLVSSSGGLESTNPTESSSSDGSSSDGPVTAESILDGSEEPVDGEDTVAADGTPSSPEPVAPAEDDGTPAPSEPEVVVTPLDGPGRQRLTGRDLVYVGAFRTGGLSSSTGTSMTFVGMGLAFRPEGDPRGPADGHPGSLFMSTHGYQNLIVEIAIPAPSRARPATWEETETFGRALPEGAIIAGPHDVIGAFRPATGHDGSREITTKGLFWHEGRLWWTASEYYNVQAADTPFLGYWSESEGPRGVWNLQGDGAQQLRCSGYLTRLPRWFADRYAGGKELACGHTKVQGLSATSLGPSLFAFDPDRRPAANRGSIQAEALLLYPWTTGDSSTTGEFERSLDDWQPPSEYHGAAWLEFGESHAFIAGGFYGMGTHYYHTFGPGWNGTRGYHATGGYSTHLLLFDPAHLAAVASGELNSWDVQPYERIEIGATKSTEGFWPVPWSTGVSEDGREYAGPCRVDVGGIAFDQANGLIYVLQPQGWKAGQSQAPLIHVWRIAR